MCACVCEREEAPLSIRVGTIIYKRGVGTIGTKKHLFPVRLCLTLQLNVMFCELFFFFFCFRTKGLYVHVGKYVLEFLFLKKHKTLEETFHPVKEQKGYASSESVSFKNKKQIILKLSPSSEFKVCAFWH